MIARPKTKSGATRKTKSATPKSGWMNQPGGDIMWGDMAISKELSPELWQQYADKLNAGATSPSANPWGDAKESQSTATKPPTPSNWGDPPARQTADRVQLPDGTMGSSTMRKWMETNIKKHGMPKEWSGTTITNTPSADQSLGSSGGLFDSSPKPQPANPAQSFLMAEQEKLKAPPAAETTSKPQPPRSGGGRMVGPTPQTSKLGPGSAAFDGNMKFYAEKGTPETLHYGSSKINKYDNPEKWMQFADRYIRGDISETQKAIDAQKKSNNPANIINNGAAWADRGAQQNFQNQNFNKPISDQDLQRMQSVQDQLNTFRLNQYLQNTKFIEPGPNQMPFTYESDGKGGVQKVSVPFSDLSKRSTSSNPLDKLDNITQARDIQGNLIDTADMLTGGGVKLQKNQRADNRRDGAGAGAGLQFRNVDGQTRVVGNTAKSAKASNKESTQPTGMIARPPQPYKPAMGQKDYGNLR